MMKIVVATAIVSGTLFLGAAAAAAMDLNSQPGFMAEAVQRVQRALPDYEVESSGTLEARVLQSGKEKFHIDFERVYDYCQRNADSCDAALSDYVQKTVAVVSLDVPKSKSALRAAIRSLRDVRGYQQMSAAHPELAPIARPITGELWEVCLIDTPAAAALLEKSKLAQYAVTEANALDVCEEDVAHSLPAFDTAVHWIPVGEARGIAGDYYMSSLFLQHDAWADVAKAFDGKLLISVPDPSVVIYARGDDASTLAAIRRMSASVLAKSQRPLSGQVMKWTASGWDVISTSAGAE